MKKQSILNGRSLLLCCIVIAVLSRTVLLGQYPGGTSADEAFAGYEAWSVLNYGTDSWGYANPVYFTVWGSGMSVLNSYLMMPFIAIGGLNTVTIRLPQMIFGVLSVYILYRLLKKTSSEQTALWGAFLLAISSWHIMTTRYGMDANLAPAFILLAVYFGVLGLDREKYLVVSAVFWGLSLYTYATVWTFVPVFLGIAIVYCLWTRKVVFSRWIVSAGAVLFALALPLLLFVAVNVGIITEIRTAFLSIPKLVVFRGDEMNLRDLLSNVLLAVKLFLTQNDYNMWNSIPYFGVYYLFSTPFIIIGVIKALISTVKSLRQRSFSFDFLLLAWVVVAASFAVLQKTNINRINVIHMAMFILLAKGIMCFAHKIKHYASPVLLAAYAVSFVLFECYYFTTYQDMISERQLAGADEALQYADMLYQSGDYEVIHVTGQLRHSQVLLYTQYSTDRYIEEVEWKNYPDKYLVAKSFGNYYWDDEEEALQETGIYVIRKAEAEVFDEAGYMIEPFGYCAVAYKER